MEETARKAICPFCFKELKAEKIRYRFGKNIGRSITPDALTPFQSKWYKELFQVWTEQEKSQYSAVENGRVIKDEFMQCHPMKYFVKKMAECEAQREEEVQKLTEDEDEELVIGDVKFELTVPAEESNELCRGEIQIFVLRAKLLPVCSTCFHELPEDILEHPSFHVDLLGRRDCGKTSYIAIMRGLAEMSLMTRRGIMFKPVRYETEDEERFRTIIHDLMFEGKIAPSTFPNEMPTHTFRVKRTDGSVMGLLFVHDMAGENVTEDKKVEGIMFHLAAMDGYLLFADGEALVGENARNADEIAALREEEYEKALKVAKEGWDSNRMKLSEVFPEGENARGIAAYTGLQRVMPALTEILSDTVQEKKAYLGLVVSRFDKIQSPFPVELYRDNPASLPDAETEEYQMRLSQIKGSLADLEQGYNGRVINRNFITSIQEFLEEHRRSFLTLQNYAFIADPLVEFVNEIMCEED